MRIKLKLEGSLKYIYKDKCKELVMEIEEAISVRDVLRRFKINPLVVQFVLIDGVFRSKDHVVSGENVEISVIGPISGG